MPASADLLSAPTVFDRLRTELADLAFDLERQGRLDAADVVMQLDARVRELAGDEGLGVAGVADPGAFCGQPARGRLDDRSPAR